jgi:RNA polymerase sigma-70 factor (ECF subfamily)
MLEATLAQVASRADHAPAGQGAEASLVAALVRGERAAIEAFYRAHVGAVYAFAFARVGGVAADAEDVTQEAFIIALREVPRFGGRSSLRTWLLGIAKNKARERLRASGRAGAPSAEVADALLAIEARDVTAEIAQAEETQRLVGAALADLPGHYRQALEDKYVRGLTFTEMATEPRSAKAVESLVVRARRAFADALRRLSRDDDEDPASSGPPGDRR